MPLNLFGNDGTGDGNERLGGGRLHSGMQVDGEPVALEVWRATTADPDAADALAELLEADGVNELDTDKDEIYEIMGTVDELDVLVQSDGVFVSLVLWGNGNKVAETDGTHLIEDGVVTDKISPLTADKPLDEVLAMGFKPSIRVYCTLAGAPDAGSFVYFSGSRSAMQEFAEVEAQLKEMGDGQHAATLSLEQITTKKGRQFTKPRMVLMAHAEADETTDTDTSEAEEAPQPRKVTKKATKKAPAKKAAAKKATKKVAKKAARKR